MNSSKLQTSSGLVRGSFRLYFGRGWTEAHRGWESMLFFSSRGAGGFEGKPQGKSGGWVGLLVVGITLRGSKWGNVSTFGSFGGWTHFGSPKLVSAPKWKDVWETCGF